MLRSICPLAAIGTFVFGLWMGNPLPGTLLSSVVIYYAFFWGIPVFWAKMAEIREDAAEINKGSENWWNSRDRR